MSLHQWMYAPSKDVVQGGAVLLEPSEGWKLLRTSSFGRSQLQELLRQIFEGLAGLHASNVTHRDIKTSNVLWGLWDPTSDAHLSSRSHLKVNLIDFSSAYDSESLQQGFFGPAGPTSNEETLEAMPPERIFADMYSDSPPNTFEDGSRKGGKADVHVPSPMADIWSAGVLFLEMLLGTRAVFTVDQRTRALLTWKMRHETEEELERVLFVAALADFCITSPNSNADNEDNRRSRRKPAGCTNRDVLAALHRRDPLEIGFYSLLGIDGIDLLRKILRWKPEDRLTASQALDHPFLKLKPAGSGSQSDNCLPSPEGADPMDAASNQQRIQSCEFALLAAPDDTAQSFTHTDKFDVGPYVCPGCGRRFDLYNSCLRHAVSRGHGLWCNPSYSSDAVETNSPMIPTAALVDPTSAPATSHTLPPCLSTHAHLPSDLSSGWCDAQGRRQYLEDHTAVMYGANYSLWSVFDGHLGASAAQFVAHFLPPALIRTVNAKRPTTEQVRRAFLETDAALLREQSTDALPSSSIHSNSMTEMAENQSPSNVSLIRQILYPSSQKSSYLPTKETPERSAAETSARTAEKARKGSSSPRQAGTTATVAFLTRSGVLVVANVGDSRAVLCCSASAQAVPLTVDHVASNPEEKARIEALGGTIALGGDQTDNIKAGNTARVNGEIVVTRSFGDGHMKNLLTAEPHVTIVDINAVKSSENSVGMHQDDIKDGLEFDFLVLASDGLWDVMSSNEAVAYVKARRNNQESWQAVATALTHEALLRGSLDNVGVCVINLKERTFEE
jgi:serine/threonine protein phosphatase PrpC